VEDFATDFDCTPGCTPAVDGEHHMCTTILPFVVGFTDTLAADASTELSIPWLPGYVRQRSCALLPPPPPLPPQPGSSLVPSRSHGVATRFSPR
jgi:hypothetical protein